MIRTVTSEDTDAVVGLAVSSGLFSAEDADVVEKLMSNYFSVKQDDGHACLIDEDTESFAVAYYEPAVATDGTWYLTMIAVRSDIQGNGRGGALLRYVEGDLRGRAQRLLLVEPQDCRRSRRRGRFTPSAATSTKRPCAITTSPAMTWCSIASNSSASEATSRLHSS